MKKLPIHPFANLLPRMTDAEYEATKADVLARGKFLRPAVTVDGQILDGRHRQDISIETGIPLPTEKLDRRAWPNPIDYVISAAHGRNMTDSQKAAAAAGIERELAREAILRSRSKLKQNRGGNPSTTDAESTANGKSRDLAGGLFGVSGRYVQEAKALRQNAPDLFAQVFSGKLTLPKAKAQFARHAKKKDVTALAGMIRLGAKENCRVLVGDNVELMNRQAAGSARVVFADPPYNNGWHYDADPYRDRLTVDDYLALTRTWMKAAARLLDERGSLFVLIDDANSDFFGVELRKLGLFRRNTIVWWEHFPNHTNGNHSRAARFIHYYTKAAKGFVWNAEAIKVPSRRNEIGDARGVHGGKVPDNVWAVTRKVGNAADRVPFDDAPPQIPVEVPERCILAASHTGDLIVDPFNGNGTTGVAALLNGRRYLGIDRSVKYAAQSEQWIKAQLAEHRGERKAKA